MNLLTDKIFFIDFNSIAVLFPFEIAGPIEHYGVLEQYRDKKYTMKEMNAIIAELIEKQPYVPTAMNISIHTMYTNQENETCYHHSIHFKNHLHTSQQRKEDHTIQFLFAQPALV